MSEQIERRTTVWREIVPANPPKHAWAAIWGIIAPWAHPLWSDYAMTLFDLTTPLERPATLHLPDATHEVVLYALNPDHRLKPDVPMTRQRYGYLHPANYGYQFRAGSNDVALARVQAVVDEIAAGRLSPDTDWRSRWDAMWQDACPLVRNILPELLGAGGKLHG